MAARIVVKVLIDPQQDAEFDRALELLQELVDWSAADVAGTFELEPRRGNAVDTTSVVLWMLVSQRMNPERTLESAVKRLIQWSPSAMPTDAPRWRVKYRDALRATSFYSQSRGALHDFSSPQFPSVSNNRPISSSTSSGVATVWATSARRSSRYRWRSRCAANLTAPADIPSSSVTSPFERFKLSALARSLLLRLKPDQHLIQ